MNPAGNPSAGHAAVAWRPMLMMMFALALSGCASLVSSATDRMAQNLATALNNQNDPETVRSAAPAYLLLLDALIEGDPQNGSLHTTAARLNAAYAGVFVTEPERRQGMVRKAFSLVQRAWCLDAAQVCGIHARPFEDFQKVVAAWPAAGIGLLYDFGVVWAGYIEQHADDWNAVAQIPKVAAIMKRVAALDESYERGGPHLYLGVIESLVQPALGGHPDRARDHFRRAIDLSGGENLMAAVLYAERYARTVFDRELHDRLLKGVLEAPSEKPELTLMNVIAKTRARALLASAGDYF